MNAPHLPRVLVLDREPGPERPSNVLPRFVRTISEAMRELRKAGYDAVALRVERPDELSLVLRIKGAAPDVPLFALVPGADSDLDSMLRESGADQVVAEGSMGQLLDATDDLIRRSREVMARSRALRRQQAELIGRAQAIQVKKANLAEVPVQCLSTLVVEDDPDQGHLMKWAFTKLNLPPPTALVTNGEAAISYLGGGEVSGPRRVPRSDARASRSPSSPEVGL